MSTAVWEKVPMLRAVEEERPTLMAARESRPRVPTDTPSEARTFRATASARSERRGHGKNERGQKAKEKE